VASAAASSSSSDDENGSSSDSEIEIDLGDNDINFSAVNRAEGAQNNNGSTQFMMARMNDEEQFASLNRITPQMLENVPKHHLMMYLLGMGRSVARKRQMAWDNSAKFEPLNKKVVEFIENNEDITRREEPILGNYVRTMKKAGLDNDYKL